MNKKNAENMLSRLKNCSMMIHIGSTQKAINYINAKLSIDQVDINFDNYGIKIKDMTNDEAEVVITYAKLIDIKLTELKTKIILTYRYDTVYIDIEF